MAALAFEASPRALAPRTGLALESACTVVGLLASLGIVTPVVRERSSDVSARSAVEWAVSEGILANRVDSQLALVSSELAAYTADGLLEVCWELHHDGSRSVDVSVLRDEVDPALLEHFTGSAWVEFDVVDHLPIEMGLFRVLRPAPPGTESAAWMQEAVHRAGSSADLLANEAIGALTNVCGLPSMLGFVSERRDGLRVLFAITSRAAFDEILVALAIHGVSPSVVARLRMFAPVVGGGTPVRLAVDATSAGLGPRIGLEVFEPEALRLLPGVLDALGLDGGPLAEFSASLGTPAAERRLAQAGDAISDVHRRKVLHAKVTFDGDDVSAKSYLSVRSECASHAGSTVEDLDVPPTWEFHDLLFHSQVRNGRVRRRLGGTARFSVMPGAPIELSAEPHPGDVVLPAIDIASVVRADLPLGQGMRQRISDRDWTGPELALERLAEVLARVCEPLPRQDVVMGAPIERVGHPYPSGGGLYETDVVVIANRVTELEVGAYLYRPASHSLTRLRGSADAVQSLLLAASEGTGGGTSTPQAMLICAARFPDLAVKYEGIAYALMVKHVGVLMAAVGYAATAMGLGSVAIGTGNSDDFARATGLDYYRHGSTGEMALSVPPATGSD
ncbi:MAG: SagB/ThcOx family dehydrogenase [Actinobacteria bacterium]|uniref:Unannotated protein n=1 Tax=freshwater metagenome TaxID=449393 RepID=A0A6J7ES02_9ZZZZ|nr:SagB/ThcOx family dehydrogenase [Actinomycetota bacterium]